MRPCRPVAELQRPILTHPTDVVFSQPGTLELVFSPSDGSRLQRFKVHDFKAGGVGMAM